MRNTAGLLVNCNGKFLLVRQRGTGKYSIPKGEIHDGESHLDAAIRETAEECGLIVDKKDIYDKEYICFVDMPHCRRKLFYYKANVGQEMYDMACNRDDGEVDKVQWCGIEEAISLIQVSQVSILWDGGVTINRRILDKMSMAGWLYSEKHPSEGLYVYDYTDKCKKDKAWNELTLWCRGLVINDDGRVVAFPLKKFFEYDQLFPECRTFDGTFEVSEKIDGFLGITYFIDGLPYIATRRSFVSQPAIKATSILYSKYLDDISKMDSRYSYIFEIVYPNSYLVLNYGDIEDIFLIDIIDNTTGCSVIRDVPTLSFKVIKQTTNAHSLEFYLKQNRPGKEGLVAKFPDGERLKIKYQWFKNKYKEKHAKE